MLFEQHILECIRQVGLGSLANFDRKLDAWLNGKSIAHFINKNWAKQPSYYKGNRFSIVGHNQPISIPKNCKKFDFELEFGIFLCGTGKDISASKANEHILAQHYSTTFRPETYN